MANPWKGYFNKVKESVSFLKEQGVEAPKCIIVLSGGLSKITDEIKQAKVIHSSDIPHFPSSTAEGHKGEIIFGRCRKIPVAVMLGRTHYYEGEPMQEITFPIHVLHTFGAKSLIITNAAGGVNPTFRPGDLMLIRDHINMLGDNPLRGVSNQTKHQFVDLTNAYNNSLQVAAQNVAIQNEINLREGVYLATTGPSYETPAEVRAFRHWGVDAVGMSTIPEVIVANYHKMQVIGISCIANMAADLHAGSMNHNEVLRAVKKAEPKLIRLITGMVERCANARGSSQSVKAA